MNFLLQPARQFANKLREINRRYEGRRIEMSKGVRITLLLLRLYLLLLVGLMVYSFTTKL